MHEVYLSHLGNKLIIRNTKTPGIKRSKWEREREREREGSEISL